MRIHASVRRRLLVPAVTAIVAIAAFAPPGDVLAAAGQASNVEALAAAAPPASTELHRNGAWSWFGDPRAVYFEGQHKRTYVGYIDSVGNIIVSMYDHDTTRRTTAVLQSGFQVDDHNNPSILVRPNGSLLVFWSAHGGATMYYRRSARPEDVSAWGQLQTVPTNLAGNRGYTYPNPVQLSAEGDRIYLFWRGGDFNPAFSTANDGVPWAAARSLITMPGQRPYVKVASNGRDTIHFAFTEAHPRDFDTSIYYMYYRDGSLFRADGSRIGPLGTAVRPDQATRIYNGAGSGIPAWVHDIAIDSAGKPVITYATIPANTDHRYHYARWTGTQWFTTELTSAGGSISTNPVEGQYSGGITLDPTNPSAVYLSRPVDGVHEIERWDTTDGGHTWQTTPITAGSTEDNVRPISPRGLVGDGPLNVIWMSGHYGTYTTFRTRIMRTGAHPDNPAPSSRWNASPRSGTAPLTVTFDGRESLDPNGAIATHTWDFGDGGHATGATASHTYTRPGTYWVSLRVTDNHRPTPGNDVLVKAIEVS